MDVRHEQEWHSVPLIVLITKKTIFDFVETLCKGRIYSKHCCHFIIVTILEI